ncbi:ATP-binding protein [Streptomyces sp. DT224]|uniref:ATP-binding protein n=1 Tax=Streptomyces sp. DT224 TaxID=3393426 RepID=UPI003CF74388
MSETSADAVETAQLLVSELATNAVRHSEEGQAPTRPRASQSSVQTFELLLETVSGAVRLSVWDRDLRPPVLKEVGVDAMGGRGIFIVAAMSRAGGTTRPGARRGRWCGLRSPLLPRARVRAAPLSSCHRADLQRMTVEHSRTDGPTRT